MRVADGGDVVALVVDVASGDLADGSLSHSSWSWEVFHFLRLDSVRPSHKPLLRRLAMGHNLLNLPFQVVRYIELVSGFDLPSSL